MDVPAAPVRVAFLHADDLTAEEDAARSWCRSVADDVESLSLSDVAAGALDAETFDVLWWHADDAVDANDRSIAGEIQEFVASGGGLLLTLRALGAVSELGIDPVAPDDEGVRGVSGPSGLYVKALFADHPIMEGFDVDDGRLLTCDAGERAYACYDDVLPARGDVLASTVAEDGLHVGRKIAVQWHLGEGAVVGVGDGFSFDERRDFSTAHDHDRLARNLLTTLGTGGTPEFSDRPDDREGMAALRERVDARDAREGTHGDQPNHRPAYHLSPPAGWLNDPNGLVEHAGTYHVFYQYNPGGPMHDTIHWGHATSDDLVHWRDEPVALAPDAIGPDRDGCWSGCAVVHEGTPTLLYTGGVGRHQLPCLATTDDPMLRSWTKHVGNPVIDGVPTDLPIRETADWAAEFRDHCVWCAEDDDTWYQLIGSGVEASAGGGVALLYRSADLREWTYVGPLLVGDWEGAGHMWECPELLDFGEKQLLHVSNYDEVQYYLGEADVEAPAFEREEMGLLDHGDFYAPQSMALDDRSLTWGWLIEPRSVDAQWEAGWSGMLSLPRELDVGDDGDLRQRPASELSVLRERRPDDLRITLGPGERRALDVAGTAFELDLEIALADAAPGDETAGDGTGSDETAGDESSGDADHGFRLTVLESPARTEVTAIRYTGDEVVVDRSRSSLDPRADDGTQRLPVDPDEPLSLRVFVDGSSVELFANERECLASRVYPTRKDATGVAVAALGGTVDLECTSWTLGSVYR